MCTSWKFYGETFWILGLNFFWKFIVVLKTENVRWVLGNSLNIQGIWISKFRLESKLKIFSCEAKSRPTEDCSVKMFEFPSWIFSELHFGYQEKHNISSITWRIPKKFGAEWKNFHPQIDCKSTFVLTDENYPSWISSKLGKFNNHCEYKVFCNYYLFYIFRLLNLSSTTRQISKKFKAKIGKFSLTNPQQVNILDLPLKIYD